MNAASALGRGGRGLSRVFAETLRACAPEKLVADMLEPRAGGTGFAMPVHRFDVKLAGPGKLWIFGVGKAAARMAEGALAKLGDQVRGGALLVPGAQEATGAAGTALARAAGPLRVLQGTHPHPSEESLAGTEALLEDAARCAPHDHVLFLLSGGASALLVKPVPGVTLGEKRELVRALAKNGAPIGELNIVRKHLSAVKGGRLRARFPCGVTVLVFSDVAGNDLGTIGSGPLAPDPSTRDDTLAILESRLGKAGVPASIRRALVETPKVLAAPPRHVLIADGAAMARAAAAVAAGLGMTGVEADPNPIEGDVAAVATRYAHEVRARRGAGARLAVRFGEPVVRLGGPQDGRGAPPAKAGRGGRCQELALRLARELAGVSGWRFLAAGTDGIDGPTDAAGADVDGSTWGLAEERGLDPEAHLAAHDSYPVLDALGALIRTGPTGNNLQDLHLLAITPIPVGS